MARGKAKATTNCSEHKDNGSSGATKESMDRILEDWETSSAKPPEHIKPTCWTFEAMCKDVEA